MTPERVKTDPAKISAVKSFPVPQKVKDVQWFLVTGIPCFSERAAPLYALKQKNAKSEWTEQCQQAVKDIKQELMQAPVLITSDFSKPFTVQIDTSDIGLGAVLTKNTEGEEHVVAFASCLLRGTERSYSVSEKEFLAVVWAVEKWR